MSTTTTLVDRLRKRAEEDQACADNSAVVADALSDQLRMFEERSGHNVYAVRMAVDHRNGAKRDAQYADDLRAAADEIERLRKALSEVSGYDRNFYDNGRPGYEAIARQALAEGGEP